MNMLHLLLIEPMIEEPISHKLQSQNWGFLFFMICFFISIYAINKAPKLLSGMTRGIFRSNNRESIFAEQVNNELIIKVLLCLQTFILLIVFLFVFFTDSPVWSQQIRDKAIPFLIGAAALVLVFFIVKVLLYNLIGNIFFPKETLREWNDIFISMIGLSGFVLFIPTLFMFYMPDAYYTVCTIYIIYVFFVAILLIHKVYILFFPHKSLLFYFILYLCAQEIIPVYFLLRGFGYLFNII
jgi:hypothetical protein